jgi:hypothetical protein
MRRLASTLIAIGALTGAATYLAPASGQPEGDAAPIYGITIPPGYRDWSLISVSHLIGGGGKLKQVRAVLGNDLAINAFREGKHPLPDGTIVAALHWNEVASEENDKVLAVGFPGAGLQSSVAGPLQNIQFMVKDSKKYATTDGWGFADFTNGKPGNEALHNTCYGCHLPAKDRDFIFTRYAP